MTKGRGPSIAREMYGAIVESMKKYEDFVDFQSEGTVNGIIVIGFHSNEKVFVHAIGTISWRLAMEELLYCFAKE